MTVTVTDNAGAVTEWKAIRQQPFKGAPGRVNFHGGFNLCIMSKFNIRIASTNMGISQTVFIFKRFKEKARIVGIGVDV